MDLEKLGQLAGAAASAAGVAAGSAAAGIDRLKGYSDQMGIPGAGMAAQYVPKAVSDQVNALKGASAVTGESHFLEETMNPSRVRQYLNNPKEQEKAKGMKWLLAMISKGTPCHEFFPDVVKCVVCKQVEVKKMVYLFLTRYSDYDATCRELALLSINSFQKDLGASTALVRALALRVMSSIRVPDIVQIQLLAVKKCASDSSPYVRKCAANAIPKIYSVDKEQEEPLVALIERLLKDSTCMVVGSAVSAFAEVCPERWSVLHPCFRKLCHLLADLDEWAQIQLLAILQRYLRTQFVDPSPGAQEANRQAAAARSNAIREDGKSAAAQQGDSGSQQPPGPQPKRTIKRRVVKKAFYSDEEDESCEEEVEVGTPLPSTGADAGSVFAGLGDANDGALDSDHRLLLRASLPLLKSRNSGVVVAVCSLHHYCGTQSDGTGAVVGKALVRILRNAREIQYMVLKTIVEMAKDRPQLFVPFLSDFYVKSSDPLFCRTLKLEVLTMLTDADNVQPILRELQAYTLHSSPAFVVAVVKAVGRVADARPDVADRVVHGLVGLVRNSAYPQVVAASVAVLRHLVQQRAVPEPLLGATLKFLVVSWLDDYGAVPEKQVEYGEDGKALDGSGRREPPPLAPDAKASILWLVGEYCTSENGAAALSTQSSAQQLLAQCAPDVLRVAAAAFADESDVNVKLQTVGLAVKLSLRRPSDTHAQALASYVLELARYDLSYDLRDRARFATALLGLVPATLDPSLADSHALGRLRAAAEKVALSSKLPPVTLLGEVSPDGSVAFQVGSLSSAVGHAARGYAELPDWPSVQPDASVREPLPEPSTLGTANGAVGEGGEGNAKKFYGSGSDSSSSSSSSDSDSDSSSSGSSSDSDSSGSGGNSDGKSSDSDDSSSSSSGSGSDDDDSGSDSDSELMHGGANGAISESLLGASGGTGGAVYGSKLASPNLAAAQASSAPVSTVDLFGSGDLMSSGSSSSSTGLMGGGGGGSGGTDWLGGGGDMLDGLGSSAGNSSSNSGLMGGPSHDPFGGSDMAMASSGLANMSLGNSTAAAAAVSLGAGAGVGGITGLGAVRTLLRAEMAGGLKVTYQCQRGMPPPGASPTATGVAVTFTNTKDEPLKQVRLNPPQGGAKVNPPTLELPAGLAPQASATLYASLEMPPGATSAKCDVRTSLGLYPGIWELPAQDQLKPCSMTEDAFKAAASALMGFNESSGKVALPAASGDVANTVNARVLATANVSPVNGGYSAASGAGRWVGTTPAGHKVLLQVTTAAGADSATVSLKCEDALVSNSLLDVMKKGLSA